MPRRYPSVHTRSEGLCPLPLILKPLPSLLASSTTMRTSSTVLALKVEVERDWKVVAQFLNSVGPEEMGRTAACSSGVLSAVSEAEGGRGRTIARSGEWG